MLELVERGAIRNRNLRTPLRKTPESRVFSLYRICPADFRDNETYLSNLHSSHASSDVR